MTQPAGLDHTVSIVVAVVIAVLASLAAILPWVYKDLYWLLKIRGLFGGPKTPAPKALDRRSGGTPRVTDDNKGVDGPSK